MRCGWRFSIDQFCWSKRPFIWSLRGGDQRDQPLAAYLSTIQMAQRPTHIPGQRPILDAFHFDIPQNCIELSLWRRSANKLIGFCFVNFGYLLYLSFGAVLLFQFPKSTATHSIITGLLRKNYAISFARWGCHRFGFRFRAHTHTHMHAYTHTQTSVGRSHKFDQSVSRVEFPPEKCPID